MSRPRKETREFMDLDPMLVEGKLRELIEEVDSLSLTGKEKKNRVIEVFAKWADDAIKLPWYLEPFDRITARGIMRFFYWLIGGWMESVFLRWKLEKQRPVLEPIPEKRESKAKK